MLSRRCRPRVASQPVVPVLIAGHARCDGPEAAIERVDHLGTSVEVTLLLSDGGAGRARLDVDDWVWLELRPGDIVSVERLPDEALTA